MRHPVPWNAGAVAVAAVRTPDRTPRAADAGGPPAVPSGREAAPGALRVLLADGSPDVVSRLRGFLAGEGCVVSVATCGLDAVERYGASPPDLVLMDVRTPGLDGIEAVRRMRADARVADWVPVIFLLDADPGEDAVRAIEAGGDDFVAKPVELSILKARMRSLARIAALQREHRRQAEALRVAREEDLAEQELAEALIANLVLREGVHDPALEWSVLPSQRFSGDVVAAARGPDGALYALLADATGHGLAASVSLIPALDVFYGTARKGLPLPELVAEMNRRIKDLMPVGRYIAAAATRIEPDGRTGAVWNGGMPPLFLLDPHGRPVESLPSRHLPLGIVGCNGFDAEVVAIRGHAGTTLAAFSDGMLEARGIDGRAFGARGALRALAGAGSRHRLQALREALLCHLGCEVPADDASVLLVRLG